MIISHLTHYLRAAAAILCFAGTGFTPPALAEEVPVKTSRFGEVRVVKPTGKAEHFIIFLDSAPKTETVKPLVDAGATVALVDVEQYLAQLEGDDDDCLYLAGEFERLGQVLQNSIRVEQYLKPVIAGRGVGASVAYAIGGESPNGFAAALLYDFCPQFKGVAAKPFCEGTEPQRDASFALSAAAASHTPFLVVNSSDFSGCKIDSVRQFLKPLSDAGVTDTPGVLARLKSLAELQAPPAISSVVSDLPLIDMPAEKDAERLVIILSGDGGWASIDKALGEYLAHAENDVVGFDCLKYFWSEKTPAKAASDLERLIEYYTKHWNLKSVTVVGYSYGAQVLPFLFNRLSPTAAAKINSLVLLNPGTKTEFEIHFTDWITDDDDSGQPIKPEVDRIRSVPITCIYGEEEADDSLCPLLKGKSTKVVKLSGGHHFDGDYPALAKVVLEHSVGSAAK